MLKSIPRCRAVKRGERASLRIAHCCEITLSFRKNNIGSLIGVNWSAAWSRNPNGITVKSHSRVCQLEG